MGYGFCSGEVDGREAEMSSSGTGVESEMALSVGHRGTIMAGPIAVTNDQRETFRELLGRTEEYGAMSRRPEELGIEVNNAGAGAGAGGGGGSSGGRSCGSFVAYVGMDPRMPAEAREEEGGLFRGFSLPTLAGGLESSRPIVRRQMEGGFEGGLWAVANRQAAVRDSREEELRLRGKMLVTAMQRQQQPPGGQRQQHMGETQFIMQNLEEKRAGAEEGHGVLEAWKQKDDEEGRGGTGGSSCKECGNQAKKDCQHQRCRTCCKSRGFACATHLKSTWVPVSKRRQRQLEALAEATGQPVPRPKRTRSTHSAGAGAGAGAGAAFAYPLTSYSPVTSAQGSDLNSSHFGKKAHAEENFPTKIRAQALFKCVTVSGINDEEDEFAYQCIVKIAGHIFKGVLYDKGVDDEKSGSSTVGFQLVAQSEGPNSTLIDTPVMYRTLGTALLEDIGSSKHISNRW